MSARLGIVAGGGRLPKHLIDACHAADRPFFVVALEGQADPAAVAEAPHAWVRLGAAGEAIARFRVENCKELVFAGTVRRPSLADLRPDGWTAWFLARTGAFALGDDGLLAALAAALEREEGFRVIAPETVAPELLAREGAYGRLSPSIEDRADIAVAIAAALDLGARDQGQAAVARDGYAVALEHADGTDAMLARMAEKPPPSPARGVLAKVSKPGQEARIDLPTVGPDTVRLAARAGLRGIVVEAGGALVLGADELARVADEAGLFVAGMRVPHPPTHPMRPAPSPEGPLIFLVAGEPSGDTLGARLMAALKTKTGNRVRFVGVGGEKMAAEGLVSLFPMREIAVMGLLEVLPRIPNILARIDETVARAGEYNPDALLTIDSPDFSFRVARRLKGLDFPRIHYVAPTVWAWRPGRARKIARFLDRLIALLPFEPPYFEREGLRCAFVGHPVLECGAGAGDGPGFRARHGIAADAPVLCVLPGSRRSEVRALLAPLGIAVHRIAGDVPGLRVVVPTLAPVAEQVRAAAVWPGAVVVEGEDEKFNAFAAANAALAASGTVSLELAMAGIPHAVAYKVNPVTAWIARRLIRVRFVNLINLVLERAIVPELLQGDCTGDRLAEMGLKLLRDADARKTQTDAFAEALHHFGQGRGAPSERAAEVVLAAIAEYSRTP